MIAAGIGSAALSALALFPRPLVNNDGILYLFKKNKVAFFHGRGSFAKAGEGGYEITRIVSGDAWDALADSPLNAVGVEAKVGERIVAVNGQPIRAIAQMISMLQKTKEAPVEITVQRGAEQLKFKMQPVATKMEGMAEPRFRVGFQSEPSVTTRLPFPLALNKSTWKINASMRGSSSSTYQSGVLETMPPSQ